MRKRPGFRPTLADELEDRVVLSGAAAPSQAAAMSPQTLATARLAHAFETFTQTYTSEVGSDFVGSSLNGPGYYGGYAPAQSGQLQQALVTLAHGAVRAAGAAAGSSAVVQIRNAILGDSPNSLRSRLNVLTQANMTMGASLAMYGQLVQEEVQRIYPVVKSEVLAAVSPGGAAAAEAPATTAVVAGNPAPAGSIRVGPVRPRHR